MPRFRARSSDAAGGSITPESVRALIAETFRPAPLFAAPGPTLEWEHIECEERVWEIFQGRSLDPAHTRAALVRDMECSTRRSRRTVDQASRCWL